MLCAVLNKPWKCNIIAEGFRFMPLGLVRLRTFPHRADMSLRDVTIAGDDETGDEVRVTSRTGSARRIWEIGRKLRE